MQYVCVTVCLLGEGLLLFLLREGILAISLIFSVEKTCILKLADSVYMYTVLFSTVAQFCPNLCNLMEGSTKVSLVHDQLLEIAQTHVLLVSVAIQTSYPLLSPSLPAFNLSQYQVLFQWVSCSHQVTKILEFQLLHESFQWIFRTNFLWYWQVGSPCGPSDSRLFSNTTVQKHQCFGTQLSFTPTLTSIWHLTSNSSHPGKGIPGGSEGKCLPTVWQTWVRPLDWEDPLEKEMTTHSSILAQKIPWIEEPSRLHGTTKIQTWLINFTCTSLFSHPYITSGKIIALSRWTYVGKVMCLLFSMQSRLVIALLPRSKYLLMSWLQSPFAVIFSPPPPKKKSFSLFPLLCYLSAMKWWEQMAWC